MANYTATDFGVYPPRAVHVGVNRMHANLTLGAGQTASASDGLYMFQIPPDCLITGGGIKVSAPSGATGQMIFKIGTPASDAAFGTVTVSGGAVSERLELISPVTVSSSGTDALTPVIITVNTANTATISNSVYLILEYVLPGNIN